MVLFKEEWDKKEAKNISSEPSESFEQQLTEREDLFRNDTHSAPVNWLKCSKRCDACQEENENKTESTCS